MTKNPFPEKILVDDIEVSNPEHEAWQNGYISALRDAIRDSFRSTHMIPYWLIKLVDQDLIDDVLRSKETEPQPVTRR